MSAILTSFSTFSPSYENIANRMNRLKQHKGSSSLTQIRSNSARKAEINVFSIDPYENSYLPRRRLSPNNVVYPQESGEKMTGRVTKNTGLKKYNQRQLKDIADCRHPLHVKTEATARGNAVFIPCVNQNPNEIPLKKEKLDLKNKEEGVKFSKSPDANLIPGRIYTREALASLLA